MDKLLEALRALERLGAEWKARRVSKKFLFDTVECTSLVQTSEGVIRGLVEAQQWDGYCRVKSEVVCYLDGRMDDKGEFKHTKHSKAQTAKLFEYHDEVPFRYSTVLGIGLGWRPRTPVSEEHQYLTAFADQLVAEFDRVEIESESAKTEEVCAQKSANESRAGRALFG